MDDDRLTDPASDPGPTLEPAPEPPAAPATPTPPPSPPPPPSSAWTGKADDGDARWAAIIGGLIVLVIGIWFFLERTLGIELPTLDWGAVWPVILIGVGAWLVIRSMRRRT